MRKTILSIFCKLGVLVAVGFLVWNYTAPRYYHTKWNYTFISSFHQLYERAVKTKLNLQNELRIRKRDFKRKEVPQGEPVRGQDNIIFIETSCLVDNSSNHLKENPNLNPRQACSVEAAAKMNPYSYIYLLHSCPVSTNSSEYITQLSDYPNIRFWHVDMDRLVSGTPLEEWDYKTALHRSNWPLEHYSDVIRVLVLWKYGGTYLDLDIILIKSLDLLEANFVCAESSTEVGSSVMRLDSEGTGHLLADLCVLGVAVDFRGDVWAHNGPELITRALKEICKVDEVALMSAELCMGVAVHSNRLFFPIPYWKWQILFNTSESDTVMWQIKDSVGVHAWNKLSHQMRVYTRSKQPYNLLAQKFCPRVHSLSGPVF